MSWTKKLLRINLTKRTFKVETIPDKVLLAVIGGKGLGAYYLNKELDAKIDPLDPENIFILTTGPVQGVLPIAGRYCIVTKSPHTGMFIDSHVGGHLGPELKFAGYDAVIVKGKADNPVIVKIIDDKISFEDATDIWGKDIIQTTDTLHDQTEGSRVIAIGPAGENQVHFASTNSDYFRTTGRGGVGMLFGAKNLKAMVIKGSNRIETKNETIRNIRTDINKRAKKSKENGHQLPKFGSSWLVEIANARDQMPTLNYSRGEWEHHEEITGSAFENDYKETIRHATCYKCSLACSYIIENDFSWSDGNKVQHPEYESLGLLGSNLGIKDRETLLHANHLCNIYGMDTISTGSTIGWFIECGIKNMVPEEFADEIIEFGDDKGVIQLIEKIAFRKGVGKILAKGVAKASVIFDEETKKFAVHVRGLELPAWDPRGKLGLGLSYITSNVGGSHLRGWPRTSKLPNETAATDEIIDTMIEEQDLKVLKDSFIMCHFTHSIDPPLNLQDCANIYESFTGITTTVEDIRKIANNIWTLARQFNVNAWEYPPRETDRLPYRLMEEGLPSGLSRGNTSFISKEDLEDALNMFYQRRDCSKDGIPTDNIIEELTID